MTTTKTRRIYELLAGAVTNPVTIKATVITICALVGYSLADEAIEAATVLGVVVGQVIAVLLPVRSAIKQ